MEILLIAFYTALCVALFTLLRIPRNRLTVPFASIGGVVLIFALVQALDYFHPYSDTSRQQITTAPLATSGVGHVTFTPMTGAEHNLIAWFEPNQLFRLNEGSIAEVTFDSIPGRVFAGMVHGVLPTPVEKPSRIDVHNPQAVPVETRIPVLIDITDARYAGYVARIPSGSHAMTAVYGDRFDELALVRKTLLRMSAWMNYLSVFS